MLPLKFDLILYSFERSQNSAILWRRNQHVLEILQLSSLLILLTFNCLKDCSFLVFSKSSFCQGHMEAHTITGNSPQGIRAALSLLQLTRNNCPPLGLYYISLCSCQSSVVCWNYMIFLTYSVFWMSLAEVFICYDLQHTIQKRKSMLLT